MPVTDEVAPQTAHARIMTCFSSTVDGDLAPSPTGYPDDETHHVSSVLEARKSFFRNRLGVSHNSVVWLSQKMDPRYLAAVHYVDFPQPEESNAIRPSLIGNGLVTRNPSVTLAVKGADCAMVLLSDLEAGVIGAFHASWRGVLAGIARETITLMAEKGSNPRSIHAEFGPMILTTNGCATFDPSNEAGKQILEGFGNLGAIIEDSDLMQFDLQTALSAQLADCGVSSLGFDQVRCTMSSRDLYSARRAGGLFSNNVSAIKMAMRT